MEARFSFQVANHPADAFAVRSFRGREGLSSLYRFDIVTELVRHERAIEVGDHARFVLDVQGRERRFTGVVAEIAEEGTRAVESQQYRFRLVPRAWLLRRRRRSRIFQHKRVDEIITQVLAEAGVACVFRLSREYPRRDYCTQYEETDYAFVKRLAAEHGVYFFFSQGRAPLEQLATLAADVASSLGRLDAGGPVLAQLAGGETVVFSDDAGFYPSLDQDLSSLLQSSIARGLGALEDATGLDTSVAASLLAAAIPDGATPLRYRPHAAALHGDSEEAVSELVLERRLAADRAAYRVYDPERPHAPIQSEMLSIAREDVGIGYPLELYEHHGHFLFPDHRYEGHEADRILKSGRRRAVVAKGTSACSRLEAGRRFALEDHPLPQLNRAYTVIEVSHRSDVRDGGEHLLAYTNTFRCVPADVCYVPRRPRRRTVQSMLTATVVASEQEEVFAEDMAQVKVQFHWDREGQRNENSSCWIRCMQGWAGAGWGMQFVPRVGSEVVVAFDAGDPDRPLILGSLYNAVNPAPFALPEERTRSGLRTRTTPRGQRGNELSFEDASGSEQVRLIAERDLETVVRHDRDTHVIHDDRTRIDGDHSLTITGQSRVEVRGAQQVRVASVTSIDAEDDLDMRVRRSERHETGASFTHVVRGDATQAVRGSRTVLVGTQQAPRAYLLRVEGTATIMGEENVVLDSPNGITLQCGQSVLRLTPEAIELSAPRISLHGEGAIVRLQDRNAQVYAESEARVVAETVLLRSDGAAVALGSEARVDGSRILLNSPASATDRIEVETEPPTRIELRDDRGNAVAYQRYRILRDDGSELTGMLDRNGTAEVMLDASAHIEFPGLSDVDPA